MSKPIILTEPWVNKTLEQIALTQFNKRLIDGQVRVSQELEYDNSNRVSLVFTPEAFIKMFMLIQGFETEVAWHGVVDRDENDDSVFHISDIVVYPQIASAGYVEMDAEEYSNWLGDHIFEDEFDKLFMQGHSHVWGSTTPSTTDLQHQSDIVNGLPSDGFYIFMIWNKKSQYTAKVFDLKNNKLYLNDEIDIVVGDGNTNFSDFLADARSLVRPRDSKVWYQNMEPTEVTTYGD